MKGAMSGLPASPLSMFRRAPAWKSDPRYRAATDPNWRGIPDRPSQTQVKSTIDYFLGDSPDSAADELFGPILTAGPYEAVGYMDPTGTAPAGTVGDFYSDGSSAYLEDEGFYDRRGYGYRFDPSAGGTPSSVSTYPADITYSPTSTTNPNRPRTVAAGWDRDRRTLTTVFRDGTFYNYYGVSGLEWGNFKRARSKGRFIKTYLNAKTRGTADVGMVPQAHQELLYKAARTAQVMRGGYSGKQKVGTKRGTGKGPRGMYGKSGTSSSGGRVYRRAAGASRYTT